MTRLIAAALAALCAAQPAAAALERARLDAIHLAGEQTPGASKTGAPEKPTPAVPMAVEQAESAAPAAGPQAQPERVEVDKAAAGQPFDASAANGQAAPPVPEAEQEETPASAGAPLAPSEGPASQQTEGAAPIPPAPAPARRPFFSRQFWIARALLSIVVRPFYRIRTTGLENLPDGPALIVPNHVTYVDALILSLAAKRPMRFIIWRQMYEKPYFKPFLKLAGAIPVDAEEGADAIRAAIAAARQSLQAGEKVVIFPEGELTSNGNMKRFEKGFVRMAAGLNAPVIPAHLDNLWGSVFSRRKMPLVDKLKQAIGGRYVGVSFGPALKNVTQQAARNAVQELSADAMERRVRRMETTLARSYVRSAKKNWSKRSNADSLGQDLTYGNELTGSILLSRLLKRKLTAASRVGVLLPQGVAGAVTNNALDILGKRAVNLNYKTSTEVLKYIVGDAKIDRIVTSKRFVLALQDLGIDTSQLPLLLLEDLQSTPKWLQNIKSMLSARDVQRLDDLPKGIFKLALWLMPARLIEALFLRAAARNLDDEATVIYTSGTSSMPKGVPLSHLNIQADITMASEVYDFKDDVLLGVLPFFHSFGYTVTHKLKQRLGLSGVYHADPNQAKTIGKLSAKFKPTVLLGTPAFLALYARVVAAEAFSALRIVIAGADQLGEVGQVFKDKFGVAPLEGFGATELSPMAATNSPGPKGSKPGSVGRNLPGSAIRVVDDATGQELPYGRSGRLLFKGPNVTRGYLNLPEKTAAVIKNGWYDTGDQASTDRDGFIDIEGRVELDFSKIAGEMISHRTVQDHLEKAAGTGPDTFLVVGLPDGARGKRLVVLYKEFNGDAKTLLDKVRDQGLKPLWTPAAAAFHRVESFPMLGSGKLDKKALLALAEKLEAKP